MDWQPVVEQLLFDADLQDMCDLLDGTRVVCSHGEDMDCPNLIRQLFVFCLSEKTAQMMFGSLFAVLADVTWSLKWKKQSPAIHCNIPET